MNPMQIALIKKDLREITYNKRMFTSLLIVPLVFTVVLPAIMMVTAMFGSTNMSDFGALLNQLPQDYISENMGVSLMRLLLNYIMPMFFLMIPVMAASVMAASSFVGEKEKRTLETLLYCPLSLRQVFSAKVMASFIMSTALSLASFVVLLVVTCGGTLLLLGELIFPSISWLIVLLLVSPAVTLLSIVLIVRGSAKAKSMEESQQRSMFLVLPIVLLAAGQFSGVMLVGPWLLLAIGAVFATIAFLLLKGSMSGFTYERLLH